MGERAEGQAGRGEATHRRRRRRATADQGPPPAATGPSAGPSAGPPAAAPPVPVGKPAPKADKSRRRDPGGGPDRGLRDLVGAGHSQLGVSGALRGRDVNRPTEDDLAQAERDVVIVRRNWKPDDAG